jgi:hypothetical protein
VLYNLVETERCLKRAMIALMKEAVSTSETLDSFYKITWHNIPPFIKQFFTLFHVWK